MSANALPIVKDRWPGKKLIINISGQRFEMIRQALDKFPDTLLGSTNRELFYDEENQEYFFDRDPDLFRHILNFYRTGVMHYPRNECLTSYDEELKFFGVLPDFIGACCYEDYRDRKRENAERLSDYKILVKLDTNEPQPKTARERLWRALEHPHTSTAASVFFYVIGFFIAVAVITHIIETSENLILNKSKVFL